MDDNRGGVAVYVTSHGFGHLNRTISVLNRLPEDVPVLIRCKPDLFDHWRERLRRPARLEGHVSDVGVLSPPGDSVTTDARSTFEAARRVHEEAMARVDDEAQALRDEGSAVVLSDVPPLPLVAARRAGIPGFLLGNFTWADIYAPHARTQGEDAKRLVNDLRRAYRHASLLIRAEPAMSMTWLSPRLDAGLVVTPGQDRRQDLRRELGIAPDEKLVYFYTGRYGQRNIRWDRLETWKGVHLVGFHAPPGRLPENVHIVGGDRWTGADLSASADVIVAKAGYGTTCEAIAAGTPLIYPPRSGFAEHRALDRALRAWGGGLPASARAFSEMALEGLIRRASTLRPGPPPFPIDGASRVVDRLVETCRSTRFDLKRRA